MTEIILTRHGQTEWNRVERFRGRADVPLNETGLAQAAAVSQRIAAVWRPVAVYSSPMSRAVKTGEIIAGPHGLDVQILPALNDIDYGTWQGLTPDQVRTRWPDLLDAWYRTPEMARFPGGETLEALSRRASDAVREVIRLHPQDTVVLVGHLSVNRVLLLHALGLPLARYWRLSQGTCAINVLLAEDGDFTIVSLNDTCHLASQQVGR